MSRRFLIAAATTLLLPGGALGTAACSGSPSAGRLVFEDTFDGAAGSAPSPARWTAQTGGGGWGNDELQTYTARPDNVALDGSGHLALTARAERFTGIDGIARGFTSARLSTQGHFAFQYGRVEARISVTREAGLWPAFWLLGSAVDLAGWPAAGEIDVIEAYGDDARAHASVHGPSDQARGWAVTAATGDDVDLTTGFHDYRLDWSPGSVVVSVDGAAVLRARSRDVPSPGRWAQDQPMFLVLDLAVGGRVPGNPDASTALPMTMLVDSVRVWQA